MTRQKSLLILLLSMIIFITGCRNLFLAQPEKTAPLAKQEQVLPAKVVTPTKEILKHEASVSGIENIQVGQVVDIKKQFTETYRMRGEAIESAPSLNVDNTNVKFANWSPDGRHMLLRVSTGEMLEGKLPNSLPGMGPAIVGVTDLWLADAQGVPISFLAGSVTWPAWSPDGSRIAYIHEFIENDFIVSELWMVRVDDKHRSRLLSEAYNPAWLDNQTVMFVHANDEKLYLVDVEGQNVTPLIIEGLAPENSKIIIYALSPDRRKLAFYARGDTKIRIADLANDQAKASTEIETPDLSRLAWSPDGKQLAFAPLCSKPKHDPACQQIHIIRSNGEIVTQINHRPDTNVTWSPGGRFVAFQETNRVYVADAIEGQFQALHTFPLGKQNTTESIYWSPIGMRIGLNQTSVNGATLLSLQITE